MIIKCRLKKIAEELGMNYSNLRGSIEAGFFSDWLVIEKPNKDEIDEKKKRLRTNFIVERARYYIDVEKYQSFKIDFYKKRNELKKLENEYLEINNTNKSIENLEIIREVVST